MCMRSPESMMLLSPKILHRIFYGCLQHWSLLVNRKPWLVSSSECRQQAHAELLTYSSFIFNKTLQMCRRNIRLDEVRLQLNPDKADVLWCVTSQQKHQLPTTAVPWWDCSWPGDIRPWPGNLVTEMPTSSHGQIYSEQFQDVSLHFTYYARSAIWCQHPRSSLWWSLCAIKARPWNLNAGWPSSLSSTSPTVVTECSGMADLSHKICRPHHWCTCQPLLMCQSRSSTRSLGWRTKSGRVWHRATWKPLLRSQISPVDRHCTLPALVAAGTSCQALNSWQQGLYSCWSLCLEHPAKRDDISIINDDFLSTSENLAFQTILSWSYHLIGQL